MTGLLVVICIALTVLSGYIFGLMEVISDDGFIKSTKWWRKREGANNKWKLRNNKPKNRKEGKKVWYYLGLYKPDFIESFIFSSTLLLIFTDGFNLFKHIFFFLMFAIMFTGMLITTWGILGKFLLVKSLLGIGLLTSELTKRYLTKKEIIKNE